MCAAQSCVIFYHLVYLWPPCTIQRLWFHLCKHPCRPERKPSWSTQIMLDLCTVRSMTKLKLETLTLVNNKMNSCLLAVLQSSLSEGCAELMLLSIKTWFNNWYQLSFLGTICTSGTSQWEWRLECSFEGASICDWLLSLQLTAPTNSLLALNVLLFLGRCVTMQRPWDCRCRKLSHPWPVSPWTSCKNKQGNAQVFERAVEKERREK